MVSHFFPFCVIWQLCCFLVAICVWRHVSLCMTSCYSVYDVMFLCVYDVVYMCMTSCFFVCMTSCFYVYGVMFLCVRRRLFVCMTSCFFVCMTSCFFVYDVREDMMIPESWQQIYGLHSGNEIYHIQLQKSFFFRQYKGDTFPRASADAHRRYAVKIRTNLLIDTGALVDDFLEGDLTSFSVDLT